VPTVLAGGANGAFRMGRRIRATPDCPSATCVPAQRRSLRKPPQQPLLVSIRPAFGVGINSYGTQGDDPALRQGLSG